eukprot:8249823-Alexandrium_andersonii.AAC.1
MSPPSRWQPACQSLGCSSQAVATISPCTWVSMRRPGGCRAVCPGPWQRQGCGRRRRRAADRQSSFAGGACLLYTSDAADDM